MMRGDIINTTEHRAVLHTALRRPKSEMVFVDGHDVMPDVHDVLEAMARFADEMRKSNITDVVNIGIGGSDLGPAMTTLALAPYHDGPRLHYVSNVDGAHIADTLKDAESRDNAVPHRLQDLHHHRNHDQCRDGARLDCGKAGRSGGGRSLLRAISTALDKVQGLRHFRRPHLRLLGLGRRALFHLVGHRPAADDRRRPAQFHATSCDGGHAMDEHFEQRRLQREPADADGPASASGTAMSASIPARAIIPYDQRLSRFPAYLQQLDMESNGKRVSKDGSRVKDATGPIVWGEPGTNGQHAFFQLLHQGTDIIPVEFLIAAEPHEIGMPEHHTLLMANCLAQSQALMKGRTLEGSGSATARHGQSRRRKRQRLAPHRVFTGNRPSLTLAYKKLDPFTLGRLIALYEHRVFVEGAIWDINAFDQWGVELGKELATGLQPVVEGKAGTEGLDGSTAGLLGHLKALR